MDNGDILSIDNEKNDLRLRLQAETTLGDILNLHMQLNDTCDKKANFIFGLSGIILLISLTKLLDFINLDIHIGIKIGLVITIVTSLISAICSAYVIKPKIKNSDRINLFYYGSFCDKLTRYRYEEELQKIIKNPEELIKQYSNEIYDLGQEDLKPRFEKLNTASRILISGLIIGTSTIFISIILLYI